MPSLLTVLESKSPVSSTATTGAWLLDRELRVERFAKPADKKPRHFVKPHNRHSRYKLTKSRFVLTFIPAGLAAACYQHTTARDFPR